MTATQVPTRNGPELWSFLLGEIGMAGAVVAGGCIRDYLLGVEPKDIDIFVAIDARQKLEQLGDKLGSGWNVELMNLECEEQYEEAFDGELVGVLEGEAYGVPVNIVSRRAHFGRAKATAREYLNDDWTDCLDEPDNWSLINSFDFGILQASYQGEDTGVILTPAALRDLANKTATLTRDRYYEQSLVRFDRFNSRNPGKLVIVDPYKEHRHS